MPEAAPAPAPAETLSKRDVSRLLGRSKRTVDRYMREGLLPFTHAPGANGVEARFRREDVEAFQRAERAPVTRAVARPSLPAAPIPVPIQPPALEMQAVDALAGRIAELAREWWPPAKPDPKPWLTLSEAVAFSGLTRSYLVREARSGVSALAVRDMGRGSRGGRWRFSRESLTR
jgi:predicted DNA-binding transcriptional regulator AlpA